MTPTNAQWRAELLRIYDEAYEKKHGRKPDDPPPGGARVRRKPKPKDGAPSVALVAEVLS